MHEISKEFEFSASHQLAGLPDDHPCSRLHGHNYTVKLSIYGEPDSVGFVVDYRALAPFKDWLDDKLDHQHLNDVLPEMNPTAEHLATLLTDLAAWMLRWHRNALRVQVSVSETRKTWATAPQKTIEHAPEPDPHEYDQERFRWGKLKGTDNDDD